MRSSYKSNEVAKRCQEPCSLNCIVNDYIAQYPVWIKSLRPGHICVSKQTTIGSGNGLSPGRRQAIIWTNVGILLIRTIEINFSEILRKIHIFSSKKMHLKIWSQSQYVKFNATPFNNLMTWFHTSVSSHIEAETKWPSCQSRHLQRHLLNENIWIVINISIDILLTFFFLSGQLTHSTIDQIMAWRRPDDKSLSEPVRVILLKHIWVTWPQ